MAGTPTPNYSFPTYAETDVPDLAGAYNQAVNAIDAKIKEVADTIPSDVDVPDANSTTKGIAKLYDSASIGDSTQEDGGVTPAALKAAVEAGGVDVSGKADKFTATSPITYSENKIGIRYSNPSADGSQNGYGAVQVTGKQQDVANAVNLTTATVPNVKAVKDYVAEHVGTKYTAGKGIEIHGTTITNKTASAVRVSAIEDGGLTGNELGGVRGLVVEASQVDAILAINDSEHAWPGDSVPSIQALKGYVESKMAAAGAAYTGTAPIVVNNGSHAISVSDASTSTKGVVRLAQGIGLDHDGRAVTPEVMRAMKDSVELTPVTVDILKNLYYAPLTGLVFYKAPSE